MAKKQRGKTESPSKTTENMEEHAESFSLSLNSSDDEAPEEVTFEESKSEALRSLKEALHTAKREKEELKEKRRRRQQLFQEQKKRRLLPDDVLEEIDSASSSRKTKRSEDQEVAEDEEEEEEEREERTQKKKKSGKLPRSRNFKGKYMVTTVKEQTSTSVQQQAAEDFIKSRLYGPGSCRTTNNELLSLQNKKSREKSAAVQFVKKDWALKERAKAEKLKKRWLHRQQIHTC